MSESGSLVLRPIPSAVKAWGSMGGGHDNTVHLKVTEAVCQITLATLGSDWLEDSFLVEDDPELASPGSCLL